MNSRGSSSDPPPIAPTPTASRLAPGFRFHPTDEELISYYLKRKVCGRPIRVDAVAEVDLYRCEPWDLPRLSRIRSRDLEWYFFSPLDRKYSNRSRTNRATPQGYWKTTGKDRPIRRGPRVVGMKKTLVFHSGRAPRGTRTNWVMHEYRLEDEELTRSGISQDAYVVCRVFQKSGSGPQNGAQYGAPFVEEEWEEEEETDGVVLMPDIGENQFAEVTEQEYFEFSDFVQKEDLQNQNENASSVVACLEGKDCGTPPEDAAILLNETPEDTNITSMVEPIDEPGPQAIQTPIDQMEKKPIVADCNHSQSHPNVKEEYVELNDLAETENVVYPGGEEIVSNPIRNFYAQNIDEVGGNVNLPKMLDVEEFFDFDNVSHSTDGPESLQMTPAEDMNSLPVDFPTDQQPQDDMLLSDNLTFKHENVEMDGYFYSPSIDPSGFEMVDDLLAYFDATGDSLHYDCMEEVDGCSCSTRKTTDEARVQDTNITGEASSSSAYSATCDQLKDKYKEVTPTPDKPTEDATNKTPAKHLVNMLGAISAPPAYAAEFPTFSGKAISDISAVQSASSIHVTTGIIHIYGSIVPGNAGHWSLRKHGLEGYILSYRMAACDDVRKIAGRPTKNQVNAMSMVIRGGLCMFIISALLLAISYKVLTRFMAERVFLM